MNIITVFTPTFNRGYILCKLYESLCKQTSQDFVWLIVDDGSTDNTKELIISWKNEKKIKIEFIVKKNGGKHTAINSGIKLCTTPLFVCVDSDDLLTEDAIKILCNHWKNEEQQNILGFYGMQGDFSGYPTGRNWPTTTKYARMNELYNKYKYIGETIMVFRSDILKNYAFPVYDNEKFVTESALYDQIDRILPMRLINEIVYLSGYLDDGYTAQGMTLHLRNPKGYAHFLKQRAVLNDSLRMRLKCAIKYYSWIKVNNIQDSLFHEIKVPYWLKLCGRLLSIFFMKKYIDLREN